MSKLRVQQPFKYAKIISVDGRSLSLIYMCAWVRVCVYMCRYVFVCLYVYCVGVGV